VSARLHPLGGGGFVRPVQGAAQFPQVLAGMVEVQ